MEWTDIRLTVAQKDAEQAEAAATMKAEAAATMIAEGGIYIEDYSDIEQQVAEIAHVDLIEPELLEKPRDVVIIHIYLEPGTQPAETLAAIDARMDAAGIPYTVETAGVEQEDWQNGWRKYYHPLTGRTAGASITTRWRSGGGWQWCPPGRSTTPTGSSCGWIRAWPSAPAAMRPPASAWRRWTS